MDDEQTAGHKERSASAVVVRCAWCGRVRVGDEWRETNDFESMRLLARVIRFSDGICPDCLARYTDRTV
jgi:uncharacterized protein YlaI